MASKTPQTDPEGFDTFVKLGGDPAAFAVTFLASWTVAADSPDPIGFPEPIGEVEPNLETYEPGRPDPDALSSAGIIRLIVNPVAGDFIYYFTRTGRCFRLPRSRASNALRGGHNRAPLAQEVPALARLLPAVPGMSIAPKWTPTDPATDPGGEIIDVPSDLVEEAAASESGMGWLLPLIVVAGAYAVAQ